MIKSNIVILGAGITGLSLSYFLRDKRPLLLEKKTYSGGHIHSYIKNGFTWDEGPHVSFTKSEYVQDLFNQSLGIENILEYPVETVNYYHGNWIPHPAQSNMNAIPEVLREKCFEGFIKSRDIDIEIKNYQDWLDAAFGNEFASNFPKKYTEKYWTTDPKNLTTDWVGDRVYYPDVETVKKGYSGTLNEQTHYIKKVRYPKSGGFISFMNGIKKNVDINYNCEVNQIDLKNKVITCEDKEIKYDRLISTIPLPDFIQIAKAPEMIKNASNELVCSSVLLVNVEANHRTQRKENWIYVYDEDKYATRINCTELLSSKNAPNGKSGIQVEVYFSKYKQKEATNQEIAESVIDELIEMGLILSRDHVENWHTKYVEWANVLFDHKRVKNQEIIFSWLNNFGLDREDDDLEPMTNWDNKKKKKIDLGDLIMSGRFAQWKYYWTDDCILRAKFVSDNM